MLKILKKYEKSSGQLINSEKSSFYLHHKIDNHTVNRIKNTLDMKKCYFPITYLGCPIFYAKKRIIYFEELVKKIMRRVQSWQNRLLSFGGRYILVKHVLQTMPVYFLSAMTSLVGVLNQIH